MAAKTTDWRPGPTVCRCCLSEGCYKDISTEYFWMGKREVYSEMLLSAFNLTISYSQSGGPNSNSRLICEPCISRLRDASDFKRQVQECEKTFMQYIDPGMSSIGDAEVPEEQLETQVKVEQVKEEKMASDDDFDDRGGFDDDDDDDLDDQPLTKLASKVPKKESVDLLDLLDNAKAAVKRKSTTKTKVVPAKKSKTTKKEVKPTSSSKTLKIEKMKKELRTSGTSNWQLTVLERRNAAAFILYTTVRPFISMGSTFRCFFCMDYYYELKSLLMHTSTHQTNAEEEILKKYVPRGKKTLQVDISELRCRLCDKKYPNLEQIRVHLETVHGKLFQRAGNGMTEYDTEIRNEVMSCHLCGKGFYTFKLLSSHMISHTVKVVCENCGIGFQDQYMLLHHKEIHLSKKFECKLCDKVYYKKSQLKYHTDIVHKGKKRTKTKKCPHCAQTFKEHYSKVVHLIKVHGISNNFQCHVCKTCFATRRALTQHSNRYHTEKYKCDVCSKCFAVESRLKLHMRGHTGVKNFVCPLCKNAYMHKMTLKRHMRSHDSEYKIVCSDCGVGSHSKKEHSMHLKQCHSNLEGTVK